MVSAKLNKINSIDPNTYIDQTNDSHWVIENDRRVSWSETVPKGNPIVEGEWWDLSKPEKIKSTFKKIKKDFRSLDVLINNAAFVSAKTFGVKDFKNFETHSFDLWKKSFEVNIDAPFVLSQKVLGVMKKQKSGAIINISSNYGLLGPDFDT